MQMGVSGSHFVEVLEESGVPQKVVSNMVFWKKMYNWVGSDNRRLSGGKYTEVYSCWRWNGNGLEMGSSYFR